MSIFGYGRLAEFFAPCIEFDYQPNGVSWSEIFLVVDLWWPPVIWGASVLVGILLNELFFVIIVLATTADWFVNWAIQWTIGPSTNIQPNVCPIAKEQMPAYISEFVTLVWTMILVMTSLLYPRRLRGTFIVTIVVLSQIVVYGRIYLLFSTPTQLMAGAAIGFVEAIIYLVILAVFKHYKIDRALIQAPWVFFGMYRFNDTIMYPHAPTLIGTRIPKQINYKVYSNEDPLFDPDPSDDDDQDDPDNEEVPAVDAAADSPQDVRVEPTLNPYRVVRFYDGGNGLIVRR